MVQASSLAAISYRPNATSPSMAFPTLAPLTNSPTAIAPTITEFVTIASTAAIATQFPPEPGCLPCVETVIGLQPVPNSTFSDVAWQHSSVSHPTSQSHSIAADHNDKASSELPTAAMPQSLSGQNSSTGQLGRQPSPPVNFANWWWSVPIINLLCTVLLVENAWALARLLASICIAKVTADEFCPKVILSNCHPHLSLSQLLQ